jgi:hypothetical protein
MNVVAPALLCAAVILFGVLLRHNSCPSRRRCWQAFAVCVVLLMRILAHRVTFAALGTDCGFDWTPPAHAAGK